MPFLDEVVTNFSFLPFFKPLQMLKSEKASLRKNSISKFLHKSFTVLFKYTTAAKCWNTLQIPFSKVISRSLLLADKSCTVLCFAIQTNKSQEADSMADTPSLTHTVYNNVSTVNFCFLKFVEMLPFPLLHSFLSFSWHDLCNLPSFSTLFIAAPETY